MPDWQRRDPVAIDPAQYQAWCNDRLDAMMAAPLTPQRSADRQDPVAPTTEQLAPAADAQMQASSEVAALRDAVVELELGASQARNLLVDVNAGASRPEHAYQRVAALVQAALGPVAVVVNGLHAAAAQEETVRARRTWGTDELLAEQPGLADALAALVPRTRYALDELVRVGLTLERMERAAGGALTRSARIASGVSEPASVHGQVALDAMIQALATVGAGLGWAPPADVAEADARRYAVEACPTGAASERPDHCDLPDAERVDKRRQVSLRVKAAIRNFGAACAPHRAALEAMITRTRASRELVVGIVKDAVKTSVGVATGGGGVMLDVAISIGYALGETQLDTEEPIAQTGTVSMLEALQEALVARVEDMEAHLERLDDAQLRRLELDLEQLTVGFFAPRVAAFVAAYRDQVEPIGAVGGSAHALLHGERQRSVWAISRGRRRLALVLDQGDEPLGFGPGPRPAQHAYRFERWIDEQFAPIVGDQSPEVAAETIEAIPFDWITSVEPS